MKRLFTLLTMLPVMLAAIMAALAVGAAGGFCLATLYNKYKDKIHEAFGKCKRKCKCRKQAVEPASDIETVDEADEAVEAVETDAE